MLWLTCLFYYYGYAAVYSVPTKAISLKSSQLFLIIQSIYMPNG